MWQDIVLMIGNILLGYALIPQVIKGFKNKKPNIAFQTGGITFSALLAITIVYFSLNLIFSAVICSFNTLMWLTLFIQTIIYK